ncbi:hypothetical protein JAAARDRAFT_43940 [Jaapia argillacea MUCL 33604]|uniref:Uncharacterized protein n=1 Tax=Jaapia argillacea MUCL 33604 TaxID=933084 RepID=A0A067QG83_9AGAM|nr:hypothetical protein JAAARDRAFT_43940 [Jaapia argillacea MUCL 33604]
MTPPTQEVDPMDLTPPLASYEQPVESSCVDCHLMDAGELTPPPLTFRQLAADSGSNIKEPSMVVDAVSMNLPILDPFDLSPPPPTQSQPRLCSPFNLSPPPPSNPQQLFSFRPESHDPPQSPSVTPVPKMLHPIALMPAIEIHDVPKSSTMQRRPKPQRVQIPSKRENSVIEVKMPTVVQRPNLTIQTVWHVDQPPRTEASQIQVNIGDDANDLTSLTPELRKRIKKEITPIKIPGVDAIDLTKSTPPVHTTSAQNAEAGPSDDQPRFATSWGVFPPPHQRPYPSSYYNQLPSHWGVDTTGCEVFWSHHVGTALLNDERNVFEAGHSFQGYHNL